MNLSRRNTRNRLTTLAAILIGLVLLFVVAQSGVLNPLVGVVMTPLSPLLNASTRGVEAVNSAGPESEQVAELERLVAELQVEIVRLREIERDYDRMSDLLNYVSQRPDQNVVTANVIARDTSSFLRFIIIDRGARDGVQEGQPVINELGLVGRVERTAANTAWVRLANDPGSLVNARLQGSRGEGIVGGELRGGLTMRFIPLDVLVSENDLVLTSGLGGTFPPDIVIGQVVSVQRQQADIHQQARIRPIVDFEALSIVSVITTFEPVDISVFDDIAPGEGGAP
ncbi:MAG: rod shape-determining protein MreC [Chloroflexi bacterium]|nr:rod shape-determining protein MreC [Chloroflexota bacterium]